MAHGLSVAYDEGVDRLHIPVLPASVSISYISRRLSDRLGYNGLSRASFSICCSPISNIRNAIRQRLDDTSHV